MPPAERFRIEVFDRLESTNDSLHAAAELGAPEGTTHVALTQTRGRGRGDHTWWSPPGAGLWMSTLLRPQGSRPDWGGIALVVGAAARAAMSELAVRDVELYWPNDLYVGERKLGGILCEARSRRDSRWIVVGIGINIDLTDPALERSMPAELVGRAACMTSAGPPRVRDPRAIALVILNNLWPLYARFLRGETVARLVDADLAHRGRRVEVRRPARASLHGAVRGLSPRGELLVEDDSGTVHAIHAAEVIYEP